MSDFSVETDVKAVRKDHQCDGCTTPIIKGSPAVRWKGTTDGQFDSIVYHPDCRKAEIAHNRMVGSCYDEWLPLRDIEPDDWEWLLYNYPSVAARKKIDEELFVRVMLDELTKDTSQ